MMLYYPRDIFGQRTGIWDDHSVAGWVGWDVYWSEVAGQRLNMGGSSAYIDHADAVGSTLMETDPAGGVQWDITRGPWGRVWQQTGTRGSAVFAGLDWQVNDPLIPSATREYSPGLGRWMTPDPGGRKVVKLDDPQTWNMYAYVTNNPTSLNDPSGLDIWLRGCGKESDTCHHGYVGDWNGNFTKFYRTHLKGDLTRSATLDPTGLSVSYEGGTYAGVWDTNKGEASAVIAGGGGALSGITATVNGSCGGTCLASGFLNNTNSLAGYFAVRNSLAVAGSGYMRNPSIDPIDPFHRGSINFRGYDPTQPEGLPSTHVPVPGKLRFDPYGNPLNVSFHVDQRYPYEDVVGIAQHTGSVMQTIWHDINALVGQ